MSTPNFTNARAWRDYMNRDITETPKMSIFNATMIAEGVDEANSEDQYYEAWQLLIDTDTCWSLQGWFGRTAVELIKAGHCQPGNKHLRGDA